MSNKKSKSKPSAKRQARRKKVRSLDAGLLGKPRATRADRHVMVALVLTSLVAGILFVINCERSTNRAQASQMEIGTSLHGWPLVFLERRMETPPIFLLNSQVQCWPLPVVQDETRTMNFSNLGVNLICAAIISLITYFVVRGAVFRYDQWKKSWS